MNNFNFTQPSSILIRFKKNFLNALSYTTFKLMNLIFFLLINMTIPLLTFLISNKRDKHLSERILQVTELDYLYEYKYFLSNIEQVKNELQNALAAMDFNNKTCFTLFDITILKKEIRDSIDELTASALQQSISINEFHSQVNNLYKRINILSYPLAA
ncbi:MAG: hypothetical protein JWQ84_145 [Mucilaginibacter sp.]|nr:hypothetical protein [Mucilaginibacter sp.]